MKLTATIAAIPLFVLAFSGCGSMQKNAQVVKSSVTLADDACVVVREVAPDNKTAQTVCATESELRPFLSLILAGRKAPGAADAGASPSK